MKTCEQLIEEAECEFRYQHSNWEHWMWLNLFLAYSGTQYTDMTTPKELFSIIQC